MSPAMVKLIGSVVAALAMALAASVASAGGSEPPAVRSCTWCHGGLGQGFANAPRLAGQRQEYLKNQLLDYRSHERDNPLAKEYMWHSALVLDSKRAEHLASYFSIIPPEPANDGNREFFDRGKNIYITGIPEANIGSCGACHGPNAEGVRQIPRLSGLAYLYLKMRLEQWGEGYHASAEAPMPQIAAGLPPDVIEALASYLSFVD